MLRVQPGGMSVILVRMVEIGLGGGDGGEGAGCEAAGAACDAGGDDCDCACALSASARTDAVSATAETMRIRFPLDVIRESSARSLQILRVSGLRPRNLVHELERFLRRPAADFATLLRFEMAGDRHRLAPAPRSGEAHQPHGIAFVV